MNPESEVGALTAPSDNNPMPRRPKLKDLISLVTDSVSSEHTARAYERALREFLDWAVTQRAQFGKALVQNYLKSLRAAKKSPSTINQSLTAIRKLAAEAADNNLLPHQTAAAIERIKAEKRLGHKTGQWLERDQANALLHAPELKTHKGQRDRVLLGMLLECGLRRDEAAHIQVEQFTTRQGRAVFADLKGKGRRLRTVPIPDRCAYRIEQWIKAAKIKKGPILRPVDKADQIQPGGMTPGAIYKQVEQYSRELGLGVAPHDLRRTFAKLAYQADKSLLGQIQQTLGHSSIKTTEIYLGIETDLDDAPCDALDLDDGGKDK